MDTESQAIERSVVKTFSVNVLRFGGQIASTACTQFSHYSVEAALSRMSTIVFRKHLVTKQRQPDLASSYSSLISNLK
jgi:hypothetical protein